MHAPQQPADGGLVERPLGGHEADAAAVVQPRLPLDERELEVAEVRHGEDGAAVGRNVLEPRGRVLRAQRGEHGSTDADGGGVDGFAGAPRHANNGSAAAC